MNCYGAKMAGRLRSHLRFDPKLSTLKTQLSTIDQNHG